MKNSSNKIIYSSSDLSSHSSCKHLTQLNKQHARGEIADPEVFTNKVLILFSLITIIYFINYNFFLNSIYFQPN